MINGVPLLLRYMFDEPSSYLDVKQRLKAAQAIRGLLAANKLVTGCTIDNFTATSLLSFSLSSLPPLSLPYLSLLPLPPSHCRYVIVVEHDLSVLDYLSDYICCLYGVPGVYGVVTLPISVREGINIFLDGYIPAENLRFRETSLVFKVAEQADQV